MFCYFSYPHTCWQDFRFSLLFLNTTGLSCTGFQETQILCNDSLCLEMYGNYIYQYKLQKKTELYLLCSTGNTISHCVQFHMQPASTDSSDNISNK